MAWLGYLRGGASTLLHRVAAHNHQDVVTLALLMQRLVAAEAEDRDVVPFLEQHGETWRCLDRGQLPGSRLALAQTSGLGGIAQGNPPSASKVTTMQGGDGRRAPGPGQPSGADAGSAVYP